MRLTLEIHAIPDSFDAEDEIQNALEDEGLFADLAHDIAWSIQGIMHWRDIRVEVRRAAPRSLIGEEEAEP